MSSTENTTDSSLPARRPPPSLGAWALIAALLATHAALSGLLFHDGLLLNPDSAEYLIGARSLSKGLGYRNLSEPRMPVLSRPPGTSAVLTPVVGVLGYDIYASKALLLALGTLSILALWLWTRRMVGEPLAIALAAWLAASPITCAIDAEVLSEIPFTLWTVTLGLLLAGTPAVFAERRRLIAIGLCALAAEKTRSAGIVLWPALFAWGWLQPKRGPTLVWILAMLALSGLVGTAIGSNESGSRFYGIHLREIFRREDEWGVRILSAVRHYGQAPAGFWWPPAWPDANHFLPNRSLGAWETQAAVLVGLATWLLALVGWSRRRAAAPRGEALFVAVYALGTFAMLLLWPRMTRLVYPLVFLSMGYVAVALAAIRPRFLVLALLLATIGVNAAYCALAIRDRTALGAGTHEPQTGHWLREHSPEWARVVAADQSLFLYSRRFQSTRGNTDQFVGTLLDLNRAIVNSSSLYVRLPFLSFDPLTQFNPSFHFEPVVEEEAGVNLWRIEPNRTGTVAESLKEYRRRAAECQRRRDNAVPLPETEQLLREFLDTIPPTEFMATIGWLRLGDIVLRQKKFDEAIACYEKAREGQSADLFGGTIRASIEVARGMAKAEDPSGPPAERAHYLSVLALGHKEMGRWGEALDSVDASIELAPWRPDAHVFRGLVLRVLGETDAARNEAKKAAQILRSLVPDAQTRHASDGFREAMELMLLIETPRILEGREPGVVEWDGFKRTIDPGDPNSYLEAAELYRIHDYRGMVLDTLEKGASRHPSNGEILRQLGEEWVGFGRFDLALESMEKAARADPDLPLDDRIGELRTILDTRPVY